MGRVAANFSRGDVSAHCLAPARLDPPDADWSKSGCFGRRRHQYPEVSHVVSRQLADFSARLSRVAQGCLARRRLAALWGWRSGCADAAVLSLDPVANPPAIRAGHAHLCLAAAACADRDLYRLSDDVASDARTLREIAGAKSAECDFRGDVLPAGAGGRPRRFSTSQAPLRQGLFLATTGVGHKLFAQS